MLKFPAKYELLNQFLSTMTPLRTPLLGQDDIIFSIEANLYKRSMSNVILLAEAGQGKSAIVQAFAEKNKKALVVYEVSLSALHGKDNNLGVRLDALLAELIDYKATSITANKDVVLFFDEIHQLPLYSLEAVESIKPKLARGAELGIHIIGATTNMEYRKYIVPNPALTTRFQPIYVPEVGRELLFEILKSHLAEYGLTHTQANHALLYAIIDYSNLAIPADSQPRKALDVLDTMHGRMRANQLRQKPIAFDINLLSDVIYEKSRYRINFNVDASKLNERMGSRVFDQTAAVSILADYAYASILNIQTKDQPRGSFLFVGPTGVGKTELAKTFTEVLFGADATIARFDMGEYQTKDSVPIFQERLTNSAHTVGTPVILIDEIEKAHPDVSTLLYGVLDEARMSDSDGRKISFSNHFIIMTTNIGEDSLGNYSDRDFNAKDLAENIKQIDKTIREDLQNAVNFPQAFLGRISAIIPFIPLTVDTLRKIAERSLLTMKAQIEEAQPVKLHLDLQALLNFILNEKADYASESGGARQIKRIVEQQIRNKIAAPIVLNRSLNRFHVTMAGDTRDGDMRRNYSKAYINVIARAVNESEIINRFAKLIAQLKQQNIQLRVDKNDFMETFTVMPVDYGVRANSQPDQTKVCLNLLDHWINDVTREAYNTPNVKTIATKFAPNAATGKPYFIKII